MMHIAFLTSEYPHQKSLHSGGIGTSIKNLVAELINKNVKVSVFVYGQQTDDFFTEEGVKIHLLTYKRYAVFTWYHYRKYLQNYINRHILSDKIDLVEAPDWTGITAFVNLKAPLVVRFHGSDAYFCHLENRKQKLKNFIFEKLGVSKACAYIAPTAYAGEVSRYIFRIRNKKIATIHYGLSLANFENPSPNQYDSGMILYIGTIIRKKGVFELPHILEKVLEECPEAKLVLIGSDSFDIKTQSPSTWKLISDSLPENLVDKIQYLGKVPYEMVQEYIRQANVCIFPTFAETLGMVTIESMALQKPVVNSNIGWAKELINDGVDGFLVHPTNHIGYAQRITALIKDKQLAAVIGKAARERVEKDFNIEKLVAQNIAFYNDIIKHESK